VRFDTLGAAMHRTAITISLLSCSNVFVPFSLFYLKEKLTLDYLGAGICLLGAVFVLFRARLMGA
jgi:uncharacterized protein (DUF486 family)